ncbi:MAG: hypothetical protein QF463_06195 [Vicinamibacterales bacterium]|jgi:hypothetical protein|nr:hypothetical protein [Acidobacteriota bacterium]MDP6372814.1 hypothetical protein [Vicinamibacterales bacterium]MDP6608640.1 hypothetical protein [Vicinamibacterales bacterium]HAK54545.1 hypothetical protein [Acidobacteriota bacterium]|tara:strand:- start:1691 stop:1933 length:243 start_codon:yes stop_codon:yes gene_type:complete
MARGWESKAIESQQDEASRERRPPDRRTDAERAADAKRHDLSLSRTRTLADLERATHPGHREMLTRALEALDQQLRAIDD